MGIKNLLISTLLLGFVCLGCENTIWSAYDYSGEVTSSDKSGDSAYYDQYYIYCAGTWSFEITGDSKVYNVYLQVKDDLSNSRLLDQLSSNYGAKATSTVTLAGTSRVNVCVNKDNSFFIANGNKASYKIKATIK